jgi:hypothetical protein
VPIAVAVHGRAAFGANVAAKIVEDVNCLVAAFHSSALALDCELTHI